MIINGRYKLFKKDLNYFNNYMNLKKLSGAAWESMEVHTPKYKTFKEVLQA